MGWWGCFPETIRFVSGPDRYQHLSDFNRELFEAHDEVVDELLARLEAMRKERRPLDLGRSPEAARASERLLDWLDRNGGGGAAT